MSKNQDAAERQPFKREAVTDDQATDLRRQLLAQRLQNLEAEHVQAVFAVEQIEQGIEAARAQLAGLTTVFEQGAE